MSLSEARYAVLGNPIAHSKSPLIHSLFASQTGEALSYTAIEAPLNSFAETVDLFRDDGGRGCNVTTPFKGEAWTMAQERSPFADRAGAVNTLMFRDDGSVYGANTDGVGLLHDLKVNNHLSLTGKRVLLLGAGGAVRGVLEPVLAEQPELVFIANRTASKASQLADDFSGAGNTDGGGFDDIQGCFDLIINGTTASLQGGVPPLPETCVADDSCCYDMMYGAEPTPFLEWGEQRAVATLLDGLGMLVEQAAESFYIWRGVRPETQPVLAVLREQLGNG